MSLKPLTVTILVPSAIAFMTADVLAQKPVLEEIVVTSRKREESLQQTPIAVIAFSGADLEKQNINDLTDLNIKFPNVAIGGSGGLGSSNAAFYIRGIGTSRNAVNQETTTALYIDDEYYGRTDGALLNVLDVDRIEVLRGPQGTLFGRGAIAGAIRYITKKPTNEFEGNVEVTLGSHDRQDLKAVANVPLSEKAAVRITAASLRQDGYVNGALSNVDYGNKNAQMIRGQLRWDISDKLDILASTDFTQNDSNGSPAVLLEAYPTAPFFAAEAAAVGAPFNGPNPPAGSYKRSYQTGKNYYDSDNFGASLTANWHISDDIDLKSVTAYRKIDISGAYDGDGTNLDLFEQEFNRNIRTFSEELQLSGKTPKLDWVAGLFFYNEKASDIREQGLTSNAGPDRTSVRIADPYKVKSYAAFGQASYHFTDRWSITAGLRYTIDDKSIAANERRGGLGSTNSVLDGLQDPNNPSQSLGLSNSVERDKTWSAFSDRVSLEYQATEDVFLFTSYARGYRSGGFNDRVRTDLGVANFYGITAFDEETLDMFEVGFRSEMFDRRLRFNLTGFYGKYDNMQIAAILPGTARAVIQNIGESEVKGVEGELVLAVTSNFKLNGSFGYLDAKYTKIDPAAQNVAVTLDSDFARAPKFSFAVGAQYDWNGWTARVDYGWRDHFRLVGPDANAITQKAYGLLDAGLTYGPLNANWAATIFGSNLTNEKYLISGLRNEAFGFTAAEPGRFRELGAKLKINF